MTPSPSTRWERPTGSVLAKDLARKAGASLRQLQWWDEHGYLVPEFGQDRHRRRYSEEQVNICRRMVALRAAGVPLRMIKRCLATPGWSRVRAADRLLIVGDTLIVPPRTTATGCWRLKPEVILPREVASVRH